MKYAPRRSLSSAAKIRPDPLHTHTSFTCAFGSMEVKFVAEELLASHTLMIFESADRRYLSERNLRSTIGCPYPWSLMERGVARRMSYSATCPLLVPTARRRPRSSNRRAVTSRAESSSRCSPCAASASKGEHKPRTLRWRGSQSCTMPSDEPAASMPCAGLTPSTLTPRRPVASGLRKQPRSRESRKISSPAPATSSSVVSGWYAIARPKCGMRVVWCLPNCVWNSTVRSASRKTSFFQSVSRHWNCTTSEVK
mmetsp:Transcript_32641/g.76111  ORF Transcript_32641/g.76111 Transcript_32641/m.76111 type:complete len:254 (-) Transcript_32641:394-1155(-)